MVYAKTAVSPTLKSSVTFKLPYTPVGMIIQKELKEGAPNGDLVMTALKAMVRKPRLSQTLELSLFCLFKRF